MQQFIFRKLGAKGSFSGMTTKFLATERLLKVFKKILKNTFARLQRGSERSFT